MSVIDASVWVSWLFAPDPRHAISLRWISRLISHADPVIIPSLALVEVAGAVARRTNHRLLGRLAARKLLNIPSLQVIPLDEHAALKTAMLAADLMLKGADAAYVSLALDHGVSLVTWDREQATRGARLVTVLEPSI